MLDICLFFRLRFELSLGICGLEYHAGPDIWKNTLHTLCRSCVRQKGCNILLWTPLKICIITHPKTIRDFALRNHQLVYFSSHSKQTQMTLRRVNDAKTLSLRRTDVICVFWGLWSLRCLIVSYLAHNEHQILIRSFPKSRIHRICSYRK